MSWTSMMREENVQMPYLPTQKVGEFHNNCHNWHVNNWIGSMALLGLILLLNKCSM